MKKKILFVIGSPNQTTQMHQIAMHLQDSFDCYFSQIFSSNPFVQTAVKWGMLDKTILAGEFRKNADEYLAKNNLKNDYALSVYHNTYDLAVLCTDILVPEKLRTLKTIWVQEGMTDRMTKWSKLLKQLNLPGYYSLDTSLNGTRNICDIYCAASEGYKDHFSEGGTDSSKITVTGIPNYDNIHSNLTNSFPYKDYVLVATSDIREVLGKDDRKKFIYEAAKIANGKRMIFKLHPNEQKDRAIREIQKYAPRGTLVFSEGNTNDMIANCDELVTQYSTVVYSGIVLGKKVHSYFEIEKLKKLTPIQNGGASAGIIARICRNFISYDGTGSDFLRKYNLNVNREAA